MALPRIKSNDAPCDHCSGRGTVRRLDPASLRARRVAAGLTLRKFAALDPPLSAAYISDVELGRRAATAAMVARYAALGAK